MEPNKMYDLVYSTTDRASFAVQIESIITALFQKPRLNGIQAQIAPYVVK